MIVAWTYQYSQGNDNRWTASCVTTPAEVKALIANLEGGVAKPPASAWLPTTCSNGACQGIAMWWIIKRALGDDFWYWLGPPQKAAPASPNVNGDAGEPVKVIKDIMNAQVLLKTDKQNQEAAVNYILSKTKPHLIASKPPVLKNKTTFKDMAEDIVSETGYAFVGFSKLNWDGRGKPGAHAMAAHICNDNSIEFMDPNLGEIRISTPTEFVSFMEDEIGKQVYPGDADTFEMQTLRRP
jgi:Yersinia/Haemophilus virulence surface antigen